MIKTSGRNFHAVDFDAIVLDRPPLFIIIISHKAIYLCGLFEIVALLG